MLEARRSTDVRDLAVEQARAQPGWRAKYEELKSRLYDTEKGYWRVGEQTKSPETTPQLLALLLEADIDPTHARERYATLKQGRFYDRRSRKWREDPKGKWPFTRHQLLGILVEKRLGLPKAQERLEKIMQSCGVLTGDRWEVCLRDRPSAKTSQDQLLLLLARDVTPQAAEEQYAYLQKRFYDRKQYLWHPGIDIRGQLMQMIGCDIAAQLFGVLARMRFDPEGARKEYADVHARFFDRNVGYWWSRLEEHGPSMYSPLELAAVWVESEFEKLGAAEREETPSAIPSLLDIH